MSKIKLFPIILFRIVEKSKLAYEMVLFESMSLGKAHLKIQRLRRLRRDGSPERLSRS